MHHQSCVLLLFGLAACYVGPGNSSLIQRQRMPALRISRTDAARA